MAAPDLWIPLAAALGIGLLVGVERERSKRQGARSLSAGIRTFTLTAMLGAGAMEVGSEILLAVAAAIIGSLVSISYFRSRTEDPGITTPVALILTLLLGGLAIRDAGVAVALGVMLALVLAGKVRLHTFVSQVVTEDELHDALTLAAAALVILPLIPDQYLGPFSAFNPRTTWLVVVLMIGIGITGHVAQRWLGPGRGLPVSGFVSGFVSSIATIAAMGERATQAPAWVGPAVAGAVLSSVATIVQLAGVLAVTSMRTLEVLALPLAFAGVVAVGYAGVFMVRSIRQPAEPAPPAGRAFSLAKAAGLAATVAAVMIAAAALQQWFGHNGLIAAVAISGLVDTHSAAISAATLVAAGKVAPGAAAVPILLGLTTNTATKVVVAISAGHSRFAAQVIPGLVAMILAAWVGWALALARGFA